MFGVGVLVGPEWAITVARDLTNRELASQAKLLKIGSPHGGQPLGEAGLYFCDSQARATRVPTTVSRDSEDAVALERECSLSDVAEVGLSGMMNTLVLLADGGPGLRSMAGSGYDIWQGNLAHMGVLTAPGERGQGYAATAVSVAVDHAMNSGLVPQGRARVDNTASIRTALGAGFQQAGSQTIVLLGATS